jgi:REP element-mobilizing transposase RayT
MLKQTAFFFKTWGGRRKGAGRPPSPGGPSLPHVQRPALARRFPVHVTVRMTQRTRNLRSTKSFRALRPALLAARERFGMRICHFNVLGDHVHLIVEADDARSLGRGMKGLGVRMAKALNRLIGGRGRVVADRYHAHILRTPSEVVRARDYVLRNALKHYGRGLACDRAAMAAFSSAGMPDLVVAPGTYLLQVNWRSGPEPRSREARSNR